MKQICPKDEKRNYFVTFATTSFEGVVAAAAVGAFGPFDVDDDGVVGQGHVVG